MDHWMGKLRETVHVEDVAKRKLETMAAEFHLPLDELLTWYRDDLPDIAVMPADQLRFIVSDYLDNRDFYQGNK